ncbi:hypothetical protein AUR04nite_27180 [Glutamicibacter uratoxydans]|uniref:Lipoprotein n=1 Tax=Glutamicibacter uratoxydans TaxID=43667 RepID=A0A4Y4DQH0_GLUUR|nr:hypothetical protein [Glutamicibacter uratoxydans]GED07186.1 hypothetical protein AUR04nite_27180 [Glutamicibacter uratoxydans]
MKKMRIVSLVAAPLIGLTLLTGCGSSNTALSDDAACKELRSSLESVGANMSADFDPTKDLAKLKEAAPKIQDIADRTESDFKTQLGTVANGFKAVGDFIGDDGQLDMAKIMASNDAQKTFTDMGPAINKVSEVCGDTLR